MDNHRKRVVKKFFMKPRNILMSVLIFIALVGIIISGYFVFVYSSVCDDEACFSEKLVDCNSAEYLDISPETVKRYEVLGKNGKYCDVEGCIKFAQIEGMCRRHEEGIRRKRCNVEECSTSVLKEESEEILNK